jgi:AraC-like DNA-binding protein
VAGALRTDEVWSALTPGDAGSSVKRLARDATVSVVASAPFEKMLRAAGTDVIEFRLKTLAHLAGEFGLALEALRLDGARVPHQMTLELLRRSAWKLGSDAVALRAVTYWSMGDHGIGDYLNATCATVGHFLKTVVGHVKLLHDGVSFSLETEGEQTRLVHRLDPDLVQHPWFAESALAKVVMELRHALGPIRHAMPVRAEFKREAPDFEEEYASILGIPTDFGHDADALVFDTRQLDTPLATADPVLHAILGRQATGILTAQPRRPTLVDRVRDCVLAELPNGGGDQIWVARKLGVSPATLRRRLEAEHGIRFSDLADGLRREAAITYLADPARTIDEVSLLTGFSQTTAFYRAFKRWFDCTPAAYRRSHVSVR